MDDHSARILRAAAAHVGRARSARKGEQLLAVVHDVVERRLDRLRVGVELGCLDHRKLLHAQCRARTCRREAAIIAALREGVMIRFALALGGARRRRRPRRRAELADAAGHHGGAVRRRRRGRCGGAHPGHAHVRAAGPPGGGRERRRRGRHGRRRARRQGAARRLCVRARPQRHPCGQPDALQKSALQRGDRLRAGRADRRAADHHDHAQRFPRRQSARVRRLCEGERNEDAVRLGRRRLGQPSRLPAAQCGRRDQRHPRALSGRRAGDAGRWSPAASTMSATSSPRQFHRSKASW